MSVILFGIGGMFVGVLFVWFIMVPFFYWMVDNKPWRKFL